MLEPDSFPLTAYGAAIFAADNPVPIIVLASPALASDIVHRLNEGELAAMICDAVAIEEHAANRHDGMVAAERAARLIRGRQEQRDHETITAAGGIMPAVPEAESWSIDRAVNRDKTTP